MDESGGSRGKILSDWRMSERQRKTERKRERERKEERREGR